MDVFQTALFIGALGTIAISWRLPRALLWISVAAASFLVTAIYERYGLPYPPVFNGLFDATTCLLIYFFGRLRWEMRLFALFKISILLSIGYLIGPFVAALMLGAGYAIGYLSGLLQISRPQSDGYYARLFELSALVGVGYLAGVTGDHTAYVIGLEAVNWLALFVIISTVVTRQQENGVGARQHSWRSFRSLGSSLLQNRKPPFTRRLE